jgi:hypothetical protein
VGLVTHRIPLKGFPDVVITSLPPFPSFLAQCHIIFVKLDGSAFGSLSARDKPADPVDLSLALEQPVQRVAAPQAAVALAKGYVKQAPALTGRPGFFGWQRHS